MANWFVANVIWQPYNLWAQVLVNHSTVPANVTGTVHMSNGKFLCLSSEQPWTQVCPSYVPNVLSYCYCHHPLMPLTHPLPLSFSPSLSFTTKKKKKKHLFCYKLSVCIFLCCKCTLHYLSQFYCNFILCSSPFVLLFLKFMSALLCVSC